MKSNGKSLVRKKNCTFKVSVDEIIKVFQQYFPRIQVDTYVITYNHILTYHTLEQYFYDIDGWTALNTESSAKKNNNKYLII